ncbi:MAG: DNA-binding protein [Candidatus Thiodiazotropha sp. (ex Myrtea sp. 'scaly one' KF741663)]|nr:DNA-binding protein [Candidatus Thiodiazotropha sp. (ex Myrtea sp. 'scaly one' KF741663)]
MADTMTTDSKKSADTKALVFEAAEEMLIDGRGQAITQRAIYEAIGNRGSMTTIQQALAEWWAGLGDHFMEIEYLQGFPPEVLSPLQEAFAGIREVAQEKAYDDYSADVDKARVAIDAAKTEREVALEKLEIAQDEIISLRRQIDQLVEKRDILQQQLSSETDRRQAVEVQIPAIREDAQARIKQAEQQVRTLQRDLTREEERHQATETRLTTLYDQERTARAQERTHAEATQQTLQGKLEDLNQIYLVAKQEAANLSGRLTQAEATGQQLQAQLDSCQTKRADIASRLAEREADRRHDQARIRDLEQACATLETATQQKDKEIQQLTAQVAKLQDHKES